MIVMVIEVIGLCLFGYACGSVPFGKIIGRRYGIDIQKLGSGNIGATNFFRNLVKTDHPLNKLIARVNTLLVFGLDAGKAALPVFLTVKVLGYPLPISSWSIHWSSLDSMLPVIITSLVAASAIVGACYSVWLKIETGKWKAGKGISAYLGVLSVIFGWVWIVILISWLFLVVLFIAGRKISAASLILIGGIPALYVIFPVPMLIIFSPFMIFMGSWSHRENIKRLIKGTEEPISVSETLDRLSLSELLDKYFPPKSKVKGKKSKDKP